MRTLLLLVGGPTLEPPVHRTLPRACFKEHLNCIIPCHLCHTEGVKVGETSREDRDFPRKLLGELVKPPVKKLWYRGTLDERLFAKCAAIVGSRRMSRYGKQALGEIVPRLVDAGYTIVSGLMYGVDQEAHRICLDVGGRAIGVLGYGIARHNEEGADKLVGEIEASGGVVLSEYTGDLRGQLFTFPQRNRIVVGLSDIIVIAEAGEKSGSLNTANWAKKMNKPVYAVPGSVFSPTSEGANRLVSQGLATALTKQELNLLCAVTLNGETHGIQPKMTKHEQELAILLKVTGPMGVNEIARNLNIGVGEVLSRLMTMEMQGVVAEERGMWKLL